MCLLGYTLAPFLFLLLLTINRSKKKRECHTVLKRIFSSLGKRYLCAVGWETIRTLKDIQYFGWK